MGRSIVSGSRVRVVAVARPRRGQVWAFCEIDGRLVVHRCRRRRGASYRFQGDAMPRPDPLVTPDRLIGRVVAVSHDGRARRLGLLDRALGSLPRELIRRWATRR